MKVMLADDEESIRTLVELLVRDEGYDFCSASGGVEALEVFELEQPDVLILDVVMDDMNGFDVCGELRGRGILTPIIFLTAKGDIVDKAIGFQAGGDDYLVKPFLAPELLMRIKALLRRRMPGRKVGYTADFIRYEGLEIDSRRRKVLVNGEPVSMTPKEFHVLHLLASNAGEVFTREQIIADVWGPEFEGEVSSLSVIIRKIRKKIEADAREPRFIQTVWHVGYRFGD